MQAYKNAFADRIQEIKGEKTIAEWCRENGVPDGTARSWFKTKSSLPSIEYFAALSKKFGVTIDYLIGLED